MKLSAKGALLCAALPVALFVSGCTTNTVDTAAIGNAGLHEVVAGNWTAAKDDFSRDYSANPEHPIAVFNMGVTNHHDGDIGRADTLFSEAVVRGKGYKPDLTLEPEMAGSNTAMPAVAMLTVAEHACNRLHRDNKLDANCGDQIAVITPEPAPAPVAEAAPEPAPAVEAQATAIPRPKQDRN